MTDDPKPGDPQYVAEHYHRRYSDAVAYIVRDLRGLADDIEQCGTTLSSRATDSPGYSQAASEVVKRVVWGLANLGLDRLVRDAADADRFGTDTQETTK